MLHFTLSTNKIYHTESFPVAMPYTDVSFIIPAYSVRRHGTIIKNTAPITYPMLGLCFQIPTNCNNVPARVIIRNPKLYRRWQINLVRVNTAFASGTEWIWSIVAIYARH